jgi:hypothetical protein
VAPNSVALADRWQNRFDSLILTTVVLALAGVALQVGFHHGPWHGVGVGVASLSWLVFAADAVVMLTVSPDPVQWIRGHTFDLLLLLLTFPLWPLLIQRLLLLELLPAFTVLEVTKLAKLTKVIRALRHRPAGRGSRIVAAVVVVATAVVGMTVLVYG